MELNYLLLLSFLFYLFLGIYLIVKNNKISSSSTYLGLFFIALGFSPLSLVLYNINYDDAFFLPYLVIQTHMFWFYYYINAVIGNKISKFNFYFSVSFFSVTFILNIYYVLEISQSGLFSLQTKIFPFLLNLLHYVSNKSKQRKKVENLVKLSSWTRSIKSIYFE